MKLNGKILKFGLILLTLVLILNLGFSLAYRLEKSVFLKMYVEQSVSDNRNSMILKDFKLKYITNVGDNRKITDIEFEQNPKIEVFVYNQSNNGGIFSSFNSNYNNHNREMYGRYIINTIYLHINFDYVDTKFDEIEINRARVRFDDGSTIIADLGRIIIYNHETVSSHINHISSTSSSDGSSIFKGRIEKDIKLLNVKSSLLEDLNDIIDISIDHTDYREVSGTSYEKGDPISVKTQFKIPKRIDDKYVFYDIKPKLYYQDKEGNISFKRIYNIEYRPYDFNIIDIFKYLRFRGEI